MAYPPAPGQKATSNNSSLFHPVNIFNLFFQPERFFSPDLENTAAWPAVVSIYLYGIFKTMVWIRNDLNVSKIQLNISVFEQLKLQALTETWESWGSFWLGVLFRGVAYGLFALIVGGMWFSARIQLSDGAKFTSTLARRIYIYSTLAASIPIVILTIIHSFQYPGFVQAYHDKKWLYEMLIYPPWIWSLIIAYSAVRSNFEVGKRKAVFWFLIIPILLDWLLSLVDF